MASIQKKYIGLLGGSFDPAHKGHLEISKIAIKKIKLKKLYWIITKKNPLKRKTFFSLKKRIKIAKKITKNINTIKVLYLDDIVNSTRTIKIIEYILKKEKIKKLYFVVGSDILCEFHRWKSWKKIVKLTNLTVFSRKGYDKKGRRSTVAKYLNTNNSTFINNKPIQISSTILKKNIKKLK